MFIRYLNLRIMRSLPLYLLFILILAGCKKVDVPDGTPYFVKQKIRDYLKKPVQNPPATVWRYDFNGEKVYYFPPSCCDQFSDLYNEKGDLLCHPDGGLTGSGDGKCSNFFSARTGQVVIWQDARE